MRTEKLTDINFLRDLSTLFSRRQITSYIRGDFSSINIKIKRYHSILPNSATKTYVGFLKHAYNLIHCNYQNEYIVKNSFLTNELLQEINLDNSKVFNEFRCGNSLADLAVFNGVSKAFEIKTEYDSFQRLDLQIKDYKKVFNEIYLIIPKSKLDISSKLDSSIGIITYSDEKADHFETIRNAEFLERIEYEIAMQTLHSIEYKNIVREFFGDLPKNLNSFNQYDVCLAKIKMIPFDIFTKLYIQQIKARYEDDVFSARYYPELNQAILALKLNKERKKALIESLKTPCKI